LSVTALAVIIFTAFSAEIERVAKPLEYEEGLGIFFFVSLALVIASVILITFNLGILVKILDFLFGSIGKVKPVLLIALRYPASNHSRTGATLIMFGLIIYLIAFISIDKAFINDIFENTVDESLGGYDVQVGIGTVPDTSVIDEIREETLAVVEVEDAINAQEIEVGLPEYKVGDLEASFAGGGPPTDQSAFFSSDEDDIFSLGMRALPADFLLTADRDLDERAPGFETDAEVWQEVVNNPDVIVLGEEFASAEFQSSLPDLQVGDTVEIGTVFGGEVRRKTVIGKVTPGETAGLISFYSGVITSYEHVEGRFSPEYLARYRQAVMLVELKEGVDTTEAVNNIKRTLLDYDIFLIQSIDDILGAIQGLLNTLLLILQGYLAFSLVVGTSGLAIIMTRSVQERKQQIGMLRALGFQRRQILFSFFIESTLIVLIGLIIGISMAIIGMNQLITVQQRIDPDFQLIIPWSELAIIAGLVYAWALLFALVPSIRASRLSPVEATNYPE
ncbi:MAG: ABC transporter permease, partial [Candidatus Dojkabacteria bacterium]